MEQSVPLIVAKLVKKFHAFLYNSKEGSLLGSYFTIRCMQSCSMQFWKADFSIFSHLTRYCENAKKKINKAIPATSRGGL
jgi:hypothetical protein